MSATDPVPDNAAASPRSPAAALHVIRGLPDDVELAALVAGLAAVADLGPDGADGRRPDGPWSDPARRLGLPPRPGADAWRWSLHP